MANFYDSLKDFVCPSMITKAAKTVDEKPENVSTAVSTIIPGLLAMYLKKHSPATNNILTEAGNLDILAQANNICEEKPTGEQRMISDKFLQNMLGDKAADFTNPIAEKAGISKVATNRLVSMLGAIVVGFMGEKVVKEKWSITQLLNEVTALKPKLVKELPADFIKSMGLNYILGSSVEQPQAQPQYNSKPKQKKNRSWIGWIILLLLLLLLFFAWRSCNKAKSVELPVISEQVTIVETPVETVIVDLFDLKLPDGNILQVNKNSVEENMFKFLSNNGYKSASAEELKGKWFKFNDVDFEFGSTSKLKPGSEAQLDKVAAILKSFPDVKVQLAGFADKKGSDQVNMQVSQERAKTIKSLLESKGVTKQIVKTEGFGESYAEHNDNESDNARAADRGFALQFVK